MHRVLIATTGSLGDVNPMLAIGEALRALDAKVTIAAPSCYEAVCRKSGLRFTSIGSSTDYVSDLGYTRDMLAQQGFDQFVERLNFEPLQELFSKLLAAAERADVLVAPVHVVPAHMVAEKLGIPYIACALGIVHLRSPAAAGSQERKRLGVSVARWHALLRKFRQDQHLERRILPLTSLLGAATKVLGVLPPFLLSDVDRRTANLEVVGYAEHRQTDRMVQDQELLSFCDERTVAFSFGSFADACDPRHFFEESVAACRMLNLKCVYLSQHLPSSIAGEQSRADVLVRADIAPGAVFPLVGSVVHHGGTGTLLAACKSLKPMVIVPFFLDQPQHAQRMQSLIGAPAIPAADYDRHVAAEALQHVLARHTAMRADLRALMAEYHDGSEPGARAILSAVAEAAPRAVSMS